MEQATPRAPPPGLRKKVIFRNTFFGGNQPNLDAGECHLLANLDEVSPPVGADVSAIRLVISDNNSNLRNDEDDNTFSVNETSYDVYKENGQQVSDARTLEDSRYVSFKVTGLDPQRTYYFKTQLKVDGIWREDTKSTTYRKPKKYQTKRARTVRDADGSNDDAAPAGDGEDEIDLSDSDDIFDDSDSDDMVIAPAPAPTPPPPAAEPPAPAPATEELPPGDKNFRPEIERLEGVSAQDACEKLKELLEHQDLHKQKRGDIGEIIFAMLAPAEFEVNWNDVAIVGAHANNGVGDGGKDIIIKSVKRRDSEAVVIVDFKAWRDERRKVCAKDARSIAGALAVGIPGEKRGDIREGIVATNRTFTGPATQYKTAYNDTNSKSKVLLRDGTYLDDMIRRAIEDAEQGWKGNVGQFIEDVLCYLHHKRHIRYKPFADNPGLEERALVALSNTVGKLDFLFSPRWASLRR